MMNRIRSEVYEAGEIIELFVTELKSTDSLMRPHSAMHPAVDPE